MDVAAWLRGLGLERYVQLFRDNDIDGEILCGMTAEDLKELGVSSFGHRRRLVNAIAALEGEPSTRDVVRSAGSATPTPASPSPVDAERRQLTVMFCDLVGSTALSARLDPEDLREVIGAYHKCVADTISRFGGFVAKYMGDGVLAYFGYPQAHEHDAERAVRSGLAIVEAIRRMPTQELLQVHIGLATGLAVVGDLIGSGAAQERAVIGETPNLAARLQALAEPDQIVILENTRQLVGNLFEYDSLGDVELKGLPTPIAAFRVLRESAVVSRFEALRTGEKPLIIGRDEEFELLRRRWAEAKAGRGQVVLISAEPGIGKSRLAEAFRQNLEGERHTRLRYFCSPHHQDSVLFPFIGQLERAARFEREDTPATRLEKLEGLVIANALAEGDLQLLADLLSVPFEDRYPALNLSPQRKKEKTFDALLRQLVGLARLQPVLMIFEDLHWADPSSRDLLNLTVEQIARMPVLLVATLRSEFQPPWNGQPHATALTLRRLARDESEELVRGLAGSSAALSSELLEEIVERTDGVPLFLEELTKALLEAEVSSAEGRVRGAALVPAASLAIPATLHASLMARLDRLGAKVKEIAQVGAAIGRQFSYELLAATVQLSEMELIEAVGRLVDAGLVFQRGKLPRATFLFKHALVQDAAHSTLLRGRRQRLHARIARVIEQGFPALVDEQPEILAHHYAQAGWPEQAITYLAQAGRRASDRSAMAEAASHLTKAVALIPELPPTRERARRELDLQTALGRALTAAKGYAAAETGTAYAHARRLCEDLDDTRTLVRVGYGQYLYHLLRAEVTQSHQVAMEILSFAERTESDEARILGYRTLGVSLFET